LKKSLFTALIIILALAGWLQASPTAAHPAITYFTVDTLTDGPDSKLSDGECHSEVAQGCSLRAAIEQAAPISSGTNPVIISFSPDISGGIIYLDPTYGQINWTGNNVAVQGQTRNITVDGINLAEGKSVFSISGSENLLNYLTIRNAPQDGVQVGDFGENGHGDHNAITNNIILGNGFMGVYIHGGSSGGGGYNSIAGNLIGTSNLAATGCAAGEGNGLDGIYLDWNASHTVITGNRIGCNGRNGINIYAGYGAPTYTTIDSNLIGCNIDYALPNQGSGVLDQGGQYTLITDSAMSGNAQYGVWLYSAQHATIEHSRIGVNNYSTATLPNGFDGIYISDGATGNTIGGTPSTSDRNVISGNNTCGVRIHGSSNNTIDSNMIGLNADGTADMGNKFAGICMFNANGNHIGTPASGVTQYISGNDREGIYLSESNNNEIGQANQIGVGGGASTPLGNGLQGVMIVDSADNSVFPMVVAYNHGAGIAVVGDLSTNNAVVPGIVAKNDGLPIDLGNDGFTPNDPGDVDSGPNTLLNYPVVTSFSGTPVVVQGKACANCEIYLYQVAADPTAGGGGGIGIGFTVSDATGNWSFTLPVNPGQISLMAMDKQSPTIGNTSEMSPRLPTIYLPLARK